MTSPKKNNIAFAAYCDLGAHALLRRNQGVEKMRAFGELIGIAFQIKDDLVIMEMSA
jgi:octaprenyl-diphosphate synthase